MWKIEQIRKIGKIKKNKAKHVGAVFFSSSPERRETHKAENTAWTFYRHIISHASFKLIATAPTNHSMLVVRTDKLTDWENENAHNNMPFHCLAEMNTFTPQDRQKVLLFSLLSTHGSLAKIETKCTFCEWSCILIDLLLFWLLSFFPFISKFCVFSLYWCTDQLMIISGEKKQTI